MLVAGLAQHLAEPIIDLKRANAPRRFGLLDAAARGLGLFDRAGNGDDLGGQVNINPPKGEVLALRWIDINLAAKIISVTRSVEEPKATGRGVKKPKSARGVRTFEIDDGLCEMLRQARDKHLRLIAGLPDNADVDMSLIRLPGEALCFPAIGTN